MSITVMATAPTQEMSQFRFPRQGEWTYEHWPNFPDDGWKHEIIDGVLYLMPPPAIFHQDTSAELFVAMRSYAKLHGLGKVLAAPCAVKLPGQPVPVEPDILFVKTARQSIIESTQIKGVPDLIVEILSPSNANYDRTTKFKLYQQEGVPECWLVDYRAKTIELFVLVENSYQLMGKYRGNEIVTSTQLPGFQIVAETIFTF